MKKFIRCMPAAVAMTVTCWSLASFAQPFEGATEQRASVTIKSDGSCQVVSESLQSRALAERQALVWERYRSASEGMGADNEDVKVEPEKTETKPLTDEELAKKVRDTMASRTDGNEQDSEEKVNVEVKKDTVRVETTRTFVSLEEMLKQGAMIWERAGMMFENARFETDSDGHLRITLSPPSEMQRYAKMLRQQWKLTGTKLELKFVFPGKVLTSGFPATQDNTTWIAMDAKKDESLEAMMKLYNGPTVITAESAGLKLDKPLESKTLQRQSLRSGDVADDLPTTDAGPGFVAVPLTVTTTTLHLFPEGEKYFKASSLSFMQQTGAVVSAKLFAPKGRTLLSVSDVRVLKATDDKGRAIAAEKEEDDESASSYKYSNGPQQANSTQIQFRLQIPQPDARAIEEISVEAIAVTVGTWKQMTLTNLQENATNEFDLANVLSGAKLIITKFSSKRGQINIQAQLKGPKTIRQLDLQTKIPGSQQFISNLSERNFRSRAGQSTRTITIQGYSFGDSGLTDVPIVLVVRYPEDLRRERVNFKLKTLDLL